LQVPDAVLSVPIRHCVDHLAAARFGNLGARLIELLLKNEEPGNQA
jgi:hypothetical protein